jgi:hypothetical protein
MRSTRDSLVNHLLDGNHVQANHRRISRCDVVALYEHGAGRLTYWLGNRRAKQVTCPSGIDPLLDAMSTVADWIDWR